ncbi:MAG: serine hydrolase domain-containing protein [Opitutaceae bacterium]
MKAACHLVFTVLLNLASLTTLAADTPSPKPVDFSPAARRAIMAPYLAEMDAEFRRFAEEKHLPGLVWGIVVDAELVHIGTLGWADVDRRAPVSNETRFRIASMTKSFTAAAILRLRDAGKLNLHDPVAKYAPEFAATPLATRDSPPITIEHLLTMSAGFPEDNPWGDRQLDVTDDAFRDFLAAGVSLASTSGTAYEYSNLGYALLGRIITRVTGLPYQEYIRREILAPLGMKDTVWDPRNVPAGKLALGYQRVGTAWLPEPLLHDGAYGAMGGLITTLPDFARYAAMHLAAWPPRDEPESLPVRRATLREMHQPRMPSGFAATDKSLTGEPQPNVSGYGFGLVWNLDSRGTVRIGHSGGLPGYGSNWRFYPDHGFAVISFANLRYAGTSAVNARVGSILIEKAGLPRRPIGVSPILKRRQREVADVVLRRNPPGTPEPFAMSFFLDHDRERWRRETDDLVRMLGKIDAVSSIQPLNALRGTFQILGEKGSLEVFFTLTPERNPLVQELKMKLRTKGN